MAGTAGRRSAVPAGGRRPPQRLRRLHQVGQLPAGRRPAGAGCWFGEGPRGRGGAQGRAPELGASDLGWEGHPHGAGGGAGAFQAASWSPGPCSGGRVWLQSGCRSRRWQELHPRHDRSRHSARWPDPSPGAPPAFRTAPIATAQRGGAGQRAPLRAPGPPVMGQRGTGRLAPVRRSWLAAVRGIQAGHLRRQLGTVREAAQRAGRRLGSQPFAAAAGPQQQRLRAPPPAGRAGRAGARKRCAGPSLAPQSRRTQQAHARVERQCHGLKLPGCSGAR